MSTKTCPWVVISLLAAPALIAQEPMPSLLGWRVGVASYSFRNVTLVEAIDKASELGIRSIEGWVGHKVSAAIPKNLHWDLTDSELEAVRRRLQLKRVSMPAYYTRNIPTDPEGAARLARFLKALGIQTVIGEPEPGSLSGVDRIANQFGFNAAVHNHTAPASPVDWDPKNVMSALEGRSSRIGVCADIGAWVRSGIKPLDGLRIVKDRLVAVHLHDPSEFGPDGRDVPLGTGAASIAEFVTEMHKLGVKPAWLSIEYSSQPENPLPGVAQSYSFLMAKVIAPIAGQLMDEISKTTPIRTNVAPDERDKIAAAAPKKAPARPARPRRLLVVDLNAAYGGHRSIPHANLAIELMARNTGAFEAAFNNDLANLRWQSLRTYDALFLNNTVGPIFNAPDLREDLLRYVREGGGLAGHHGTSRVSLDWAEFGEMLGAHSGPHGDQNEKVTVKIDDPASPINAAFGGKSFEFVDEYFRFPTPPYSRDKLRILLSFDVAKTDMNQGRVCTGCARDDNDYAISWIRSYGKGRVFFTSFGNSPRVFWAPEILEHFLAGIQFALGDLKADTRPSASMAARKGRSR